MFAKIKPNVLLFENIFILYFVINESDFQIISLRIGVARMHSLCKLFANSFDFKLKFYSTDL